jgi:pimeloyl-ACP methyl ester carboxylesterase
MDMQTLVLIPGLLCDHELFRHQIAFLGDVAQILVADTVQDDSLTAMADRLLAAAPERFALAGLSMGGYVAQEVLRRAPERVTRLALLDTNAEADRPEATETRRRQMALARSGRFDEVPDSLAPLLVQEDRHRDAVFMDQVKTMMRRVGPEAFVRQQQAILARPDGRDDLARIAVPTLCLCGRDDRLSPPEVHAAMADRLPRGALVIVEDCGHLAAMERPDAVTAVLRYWLQVD